MTTPPPASDRYSRQVLFGPIGEEGQKRIEKAQVGVLGCGALGTASAEMLVRAGVGKIVLADRDFVEESNLQRQTLFCEDDARQGLPKAVAARRALLAVNSSLEIEEVVADIDADGIGRFARDCDLLLDGTDNFETRFLINDYSVKHGLPWVYAAALGSYGVAMGLHPAQGGPCLRCVMPHLPPAGSAQTCETAGILAPAVLAVASFQVAQSLRLLVGEPFLQRILQVDVWEGSWRTIPLQGFRDSRCGCCVERRFDFLQGRSRNRAMSLCGRNAVQLSPSHKQAVDFDRLRSRLGGSRAVRVSGNPYVLRIDADGCQIALFRDGRSIVRGTEDFARARTLYARYVGI